MGETAGGRRRQAESSETRSREAISSRLPDGWLAGARLAQIQNGRRLWKKQDWGAAL